jgi:flagellar biosynthesis protein FlhA
VIEPDLARSIGERVVAEVAGRPAGAALIVQPRLRRALAALLRLRAPACAVLSISELPEQQPIEVIAVIGGEPPPPARAAIPLPPPAAAPTLATSLESMAA